MIRRLLLLYVMAQLTQLLIFLNGKLTADDAYNPEPEIRPPIDDLIDEPFRPPEEAAQIPGPHYKFPYPENIDFEYLMALQITSSEKSDKIRWHILRLLKIQRTHPTPFESYMAHVCRRAGTDENSIEEALETAYALNDRNVNLMLCFMQGIQER